MIMLVTIKFHLLTCVWLFIQDRFVGASQIANSFQDLLQGLEGMA